MDCRSEWDLGLWDAVMIAAEYVLYVLYVCTIDQSVSATCLMRKTLFQYISRHTNKNGK